MDDNCQELRADSRLPAIKFPKEFIEVRPCMQPENVLTNTSKTGNKFNKYENAKRHLFFYKNRKPNIHKRKDRQPLLKDTQYNPRNCKLKD